MHLSINNSKLSKTTDSTVVCVSTRYLRKKKLQMNMGIPGKWKCLSEKAKGVSRGQNGQRGGGSQEDDKTCLKPTG